MQCASVEDLNEITELLRSGQPTYDYQPASDTAELVGWADISIAGSVDSAVREFVGANSYTTLTVSDVDVLAGNGAVVRLGALSVWADGQGADPLADDVSFSGLRFVAMLDQFPSAPGGYVPYVEGLVFGCESDDAPIRPLAQFPPDSNDLSLSELAENVETASGLPSPEFDAESTSIAQAADDPLGHLRNESVTGCEIDFGPGAANLLAAGHDWFALEPGVLLDPSNPHSTDDPLRLEVSALSTGAAGVEQRDFFIAEDLFRSFADAVAVPSVRVVVGVTKAEDLPAGWVEIVISRDDNDFAIISDCTGTIEPFLKQQLRSNDLELTEFFTLTADEVEALFSS